MTKVGEIGTIHETCDECGKAFTLDKDSFLGVLNEEEQQECSPFVNLDSLCKDCYSKIK
jgi:hypothetical protein